MVELVPASDTLRKIQVEYGVTGSFKDKPLAEWLRKYNPTEEEYEKVTYSSCEIDGVCSSVVQPMHCMQKVPHFDISANRIWRKDGKDLCLRSSRAATSKGKLNWTNL